MPFEQTLTAIQELRDIGQNTSFTTLVAFAEDTDNDPILRAAAVTSLPACDSKKTKKWLKKEFTKRH